MDNSRICHCLLFHEHGKQNFVQPFCLSRKLLRYTPGTRGLNFTMKPCAESLALMSVDYEWPLPEANATTVRDLTEPSVSSPPLSLSVKVCSRAFICVELVHRT